MTKEQLKEVKVGDVLLCVFGDWHFSKDEVYTVRQHGSGLPVVWCDDIQPHWVHTLDPTMFRMMNK
ncbi:hypothetical protein AB3N02_21725 [Priestia aryabhattai]|uniref:hypothetical protein n=1 Tax=Priestia aryabhattai TaxID=412384 RepID=UPI0039A24721